MIKNKKWSFQNLQVASDVNKFEDYISKNANLKTKNAEITNEVIMCIFNAR